jgi:hypothetical protein
MTRYTRDGQFMSVSHDNGEWIQYDDYRLERELWIEALVSAGVGDRLEIECAPMSFADRHRKEVDAMRERLRKPDSATIQKLRQLCDAYAKQKSINDDQNPSFSGIMKYWAAADELAAFVAGAIKEIEAEQPAAQAESEAT